MRGLYPIIDLQSCVQHGLGPVEVARALLTACPPIVQLRAKSSGPREVLAVLRELAAVTRSTSTLLFANDRPDLALMAGCDGVHLGQQDVPIAAVRAMAPGLRVGLSSHSLQELSEALDAAPFYVAYGPIFPTDTKLDAEPCVGLDGLVKASALARARNIPLVAIGGLGPESLPRVALLADAVSVISAVMAPSVAEVSERALRLSACFAP
jgi:thiamine-phosphate pyrophosphorylase